MAGQKTSNARTDAGVLPEALLCAALVLLSAYLRPWTADVPINDDWSYLIVARRLAEEGVLRLTGDSPATHVLHVLAGALGIRLFGWEIGGLKLLILAWHFTGTFLLLKLLLLEGIEKRAALLGALTYAFNPLLLVLSTTFMTDIPYLTLLIASLYGYSRALKESRLHWLWLASAAAGGAYLVKQLGLLLPVAAAYALRGAGKADFKRLLGVWTPVVLAFAGHQLWYHFIHGPTWQGTADGVYLRALRFLLSPRTFLTQGPLHAAGAAMHLSLFLLPLAAGYAARPFRLSRPNALQTAFLAAAALAAAAGGVFPYLENSFYHTGIGTATIVGTVDKAAGVMGWRGFWPAVSLLCVFSGLSLLRRPGPSQTRSPSRELFLAAAALQLGASLLTTKYLDRYPLYGLPPIVALVLLPPAGSRFALKPALAALLLSAAVSLPAARDYAAWNKAKWALASAGVEDGLPAESIEAGHDWDMYWTYEKEMARLRGEKPLKDIREWEWLETTERRAFVSFAPPGSYSHHGERLLDEMPYRTPLSLELRRLYLYEKETALK